MALFLDCEILEVQTENSWSTMIQESLTGGPHRDKERASWKGRWANWIPLSAPRRWVHLVALNATDAFAEASLFLRKQAAPSASHRIGLTMPSPASRFSGHWLGLG